MKAVGVVVAFWWVATGIIIAMQHSAATRLAGLIISTVLAIVGVAEIRSVRDDDSASAVRRSFLGGAMLWAWVSAAFYGGYLTGFAPAGPVADVPSWSAVPAATAATLANDAATLALLITGFFVERDARNKTGLWALALFWGVQQVAKINVFLGVVNPAANFLPEHLGYLRDFFGPSRNTVFLWVSVAGTVALTGYAAFRARRAPTEGAREAAAVYGAILALAVLEYVVLGISLESTPWDSFLQARGT